MGLGRGLTGGDYGEVSGPVGGGDDAGLEVLGGVEVFYGCVLSFASRGGASG
jgi:hypothetical protein